MKRSAARTEFLSDCLITFVESGPYSWFAVRNYACPDGGVASARLNVEDPNAEGWKGWRPLTVETFARGFALLRKGPVEGLSERYRAHIIGADATNDAGALDVNDVDVVLQAATLGSIVYA